MSNSFSGRFAPAYEYIDVVPEYEYWTGSNLGYGGGYGGGSLGFNFGRPSYGHGGNPGLNGRTVDSDTGIAYLENIPSLTGEGAKAYRPGGGSMTGVS